MADDRWFSIVLFGAALVANCGESSSDDSSDPASGGVVATARGGSIGEARGGSSLAGSAGSSAPGAAGGNAGAVGTGGSTETASGGQAPAASGTSGTRGGSAGGGAVPQGGVGDVAGAGGSANDPFEDCLTEAERVDGFGCALSLACGAEKIGIWCTDPPLGGWDCGCKTQFGTLSYRVDAATAGVACQMVAEACQRAPRVEFDEPYECPNPLVENTIVSCESSTTCEQREMLAPGVTAYQMRVIGGTCVSESEDADSAACECEGLGPRKYELQDYNHDEGCLSLLQLCGSYAVFPNEATCAVDMESAPSPGTCLRSEVCTTSVVVEGVGRGLSTLNEISCAASADGRARCQCAGRLDFELFHDPVEAGTCATAGEVCSAATPVTLEREPPVCVTNGTSSNAELCSAKLDCSSAGRVAGVDLLLHGSIMIYCKADPWPQEWRCDCVGSDTRTELEFDAEDAPAACSRAIELCPTVVTPEYGVPLDFGP
jgi:hypothetical protein